MIRPLPFAAALINRCTDLSAAAAACRCSNLFAVLHTAPSLQLSCPIPSSRVYLSMYIYIYISIQCLSCIMILVMLSVSKRTEWSDGLTSLHRNIYAFMKDAFQGYQTLVCSRLARIQPKAMLCTIVVDIYISMLPTLHFLEFLYNCRYKCSIWLLSSCKLMECNG